MPLKHTEKTRNEPSPSALRPESDAPIWLQEQVYTPKRQRTVDLVHQSIDALRKDKRRVSLETVAVKSKELNIEENGKGISEIAILDNQEARTYYEEYRSWRGSSRKRSKPLTVENQAPPNTVKAGRNEQRVQQRYLRMGTEALIERLITTKRTLAKQRELWLTLQDEVLTWRLRAEAAKARLKESRNMRYMSQRSEFIYN